MLLRGADNGRYHQLKDDLSNNMSLGKDNYPKTMVETTRLLNEYKVPPRAQRVRENQEGVAFVQEGKVVDVKNVTCYHCQKKGHFRSDCPELQVAGVDDGVQNFTIDSVEEDVEIGPMRGAPSSNPLVRVLNMRGTAAGDAALS